MTRMLGFVSSARSDFGLLRPLIAAALACPEPAVTLYVTGQHFAARAGGTLADASHSIDEVLAAGFGDCVIPVPVTPSGPDQGGGHAMARAIGDGTAAFAGALTARRPDLLVVMGDRYDMLPAVLAALPLTIPVAHLAGGELTLGVIDDAIRHAVTKLSHLHFPTMAAYADRLVRLGEEPWRITVSGEPGLDVLRDFRPRTRTALFAELGLDPARPVALLTVHPETLSPAGSAALIGAVLAAAAEMPGQLLATAPNGDAGSETIIAALEAYAQGRPECRLVPHLGRTRYLELLHHAALMVGNSSSGIVEAASVALPVIDVGTRQAGRIAPCNVLRVPAGRAAITAAWHQALDPAFRASLAGLTNPYGDGHAVPRILERLRTEELGPRLLLKKFYEGAAG